MPDFNVNDVLKEFNINIEHIDNMLDTLSKYRDNLGEDASYLINDLNREKASKWKNLRKWKVSNILNRYSKFKDIIDDINTIKDYVVDMEDEGWESTILLKYKRIIFTSSDKHPILKLNKLFNFLINNHRFGFKLINMQKSSSSIRVDVDFKPRIKLVSDIDDINIE